MVNTEKENITMITAILKWAKSLFQTRTYQDSVEYYVASKQPKSTAEVEYWVRHYDQHRKEWAL